MSLEAKNLSFRYRRGQPPVLQAVNLTVHPGERVGLRGPSGRGKTTLCKLLAGYERPDRAAPGDGRRSAAPPGGHPV